jgi:xanthine dehydrogenase accessory factor
MREPLVHLFETVRQWLGDGRQCCLCTVVETYGSSPRPAGSLFAFNDAGQRVGSLSGGCVEDELLDTFDWSLARPAIRAFGVTAEENERLGLPCGGTMRVLLEKTALPAAEAMLELLQQRKGIAREIDLHAGVVSVTETDAPPSVSCNEECVRHVLSPRQQLLLIGAGELSRAVSSLALTLEFDIHVCDPRPEFIAAWDIEGVTVHQAMPDDVIKSLDLGKNAVVLALTHDPRIDDMGLMEALLRPLFYTGALGSMRTSEKRRARLVQLGMTQSQIARLHAPVGLSISAKTPAEIAVAIMADLISRRADNKQSG